MKERRVARSLLRAGWLWVCCITLTLFSTELGAVPIQAVDSVGRPIDLEQALEKAPERYVQEMRAFLRYGNVDSAGYLARRKLTTKPNDAEARAIYSLSLAARGDLRKAREELGLISSGARGNQYSLYAKATIMRLERNYDAAIKACEKAVSLDRRHPYPWNILGRIYCDREEYGKAVSNFQKAVQLVPEFLPGYINLGVTFYLMGDPKESKRHFERAIELNPSAHVAHYGLALIYEELRQDLAALKELKEALSVDPDNSLYLQKLGHLQIRTKRYGDALATGQKLEKMGIKGSAEILANASLHLGDTKAALRHLEKAPKDSPDTVYLRGFCHMLEGKYGEALKEMEGVLRLDSRHFGAFAAQYALSFYLGKGSVLEPAVVRTWGEPYDKLLKFMAGSVYAARNKWTETLECWRAAEGLVRGFSILGLNEEVLRAGMKEGEFKHLNLGVLYYFKNLVDSALSEFHQALKINEQSILSNYWCAVAYLENGKRAEALGNLEKAVQSAPAFFSALYAIGELNVLMGKTDVAAGAYRQALLVKKDAGILIKLGLIYEGKEQYKKAEESYGELIRLYPDFYVGYNQLAWLYAKRGQQLDKAMSLAERAYALQPGNASILDTMGWIYFHQGDYENALLKIEEANRVTPNRPAILYHLGAIYHATEKFAEAKRFLKKALELSSHFEGADEARRLLNESS